MEAIIEAGDLKKRFGQVKALDGLDLSVTPGEIHGFLGPNGAGKSTTIRILLGLVRPSGGTATVFGLNPRKDASSLHRRIAYVPGEVSLWPNLTGGEAIDLISRLRRGASGYPAHTSAKGRLLASFEFDPSKKGRSYSKGNRQKAALIAALVTPAELYILDEPTSGLDPIAEAVFNQEIRRVVEAGATVLLSSHIVSEVERLCERVTIIRGGRTVESGRLDQLRYLTRSEVAFTATNFLWNQLAHVDGVHDLAVTRGHVRFMAESRHLLSILPVLASMNVRGLTISPPSLEELFLRHYGDQSAQRDFRP